MPPSERKTRNYTCPYGHWSKGSVISSTVPREMPTRGRRGTPRVQIQAQTLHPIPTRLDAIQAVIAEDMSAVDALIRRRLDSDVVLIRRIAEYIVGSGGKRLRPALVLLSAGAFG